MPDPSDPYHRVFVQMALGQICLDGARHIKNFQNFVRMNGLSIFFARICLNWLTRCPRTAKAVIVMDQIAKSNPEGSRYSEMLRTLLIIFDIYLVTNHSYHLIYPCSEIYPWSNKLRMSQMLCSQPPFSDLWLHNNLLFNFILLANNSLIVLLYLT